MPDNSSSIENSRALQHGPWFLYLIECIDGSIYTGIATDVAARYAAHASGKGARYTRAHPPTRLLVSVEYPDRSSALKAEYRIKKLKPAAKRNFVTTMAMPAEELGASDNPGETTQP
jgi:putative endonuclease